MDEKSAHFTGEPAGDQAGAGRARPPYRLLDHEADIGFEVEAPDLPRLFAAAAIALHDLMADSSAAWAKLERPIVVEGSDLDDLMVRFLEEAHWAFEGERTLFAEVAPGRVVEPAAPGGAWRAEALARGERYDPARHELGRPVKAVTYHGLEVAPTQAGGWRARVIVDL